MRVLFALALSAASLFFLGSEARSEWWKDAGGGNALDRRDIDVSSGTAARTQWSDGRIEAWAGATANPRISVNRAQARSLALKAARHLAYEKLAETVDGLSLDGSTTLKKEVLEGSVLQVKVQATIRGATVVRETVTDLPDGSPWAEVAVKLPIAGRTGLSSAFGIWSGSQPQASYRPNPAYTPEEQYTGVIIDASGLGFSPALAPRLLAEDSRAQVYGPHSVDARFFEARGAVGYNESLLKARRDPRVGPNPIIVRASGVVGDRKADLLISRWDAERLFAADRLSQVLKRGAVVVVVGKGPADLLKEGSRYAVLIGINEYAHANEVPPIRPLRFAAADAMDLGAFLTGKGGYQKEKVRVLVNEQASRAAIYSHLRALRHQVREEDTVVFFFSGHGTIGKARDGLPHYYLVPHDGRPGDLDGTAIRDDALEELVGQLNAKKVVVLLDACHSGGLGNQRAKGLANPAVRNGPHGHVFMEPAEGRVILAASRPDQVSIEDEQLRHGAFTHFLLEAMAGAADLDRDGTVTVLEAYQYLSSKVREYTARTHGFEQRPVLEVRGMSRELILAAIR